MCRTDTALGKDRHEEARTAQPHVAGPGPGGRKQITPTGSEDRSLRAGGTRGLVTLCFLIQLQSGGGW